MEADQSDTARLEAALERIAVAAEAAEAAVGRAEARAQESEARLADALRAQEELLAQLRAVPPASDAAAERAALAARLDRLTETLAAAVGPGEHAAVEQASGD